MRIKSLPENYTGALAPVIYEIDQTEPAQIITVGIIASQDDITAGQKRLAGEGSYTINTANYCLEKIEVEPIANEWAGFGKAEQRCGISKIKIDGVISQATYVTGGTKAGRLKAILSDAPFEHQIVKGEKDEIAIIAPGAQLSAKAILSSAQYDPEEIELGNILCADGVYVLVVDTEYIDSCLADGLDKYNKMEVVISEGANLIAQRNYSLVEAAGNTVRLCWQNSYGQIDYHTFRQVDETIEINKSKIYVDDGYEATSIKQDSTKHIVSECLPKAAIKWLSEILAAPKVWIVDNDGFTRADVLTDRLQIRNEYPEAISIDIRNAKRLTIKQA